MPKSLPTLNAILNPESNASNATQTKRMEQMKRGEVRRAHASYRRIVATLSDSNITDNLGEESVQELHALGTSFANDVNDLCEKYGFDNPMVADELNDNAESN